MVNIYTYLEVFLEDPSRQVNLQEFETRFKRPHQTLRRHLNLLVKESILLEIRMGKFVFYKLNKSNPLLPSYLSICEKERTFLFLKNPLFRRLHELLVPTFDVANVLVFGSASVSKNFDDIDLLVLSQDKNIWMALEGFDKVYHKKIHLVQTEEKDLTPTFKIEIIKKHIILNNHDYFVRLLYGN